LKQLQLIQILRVKTSWPVNSAVSGRNGGRVNSAGVRASWLKAASGNAATAFELQKMGNCGRSRFTAR
jgi:hypothetical protein